MAQKVIYFSGGPRDRETVTFDFGDLIGDGQGWPTLMEEGDLEDDLPGRYVATDTFQGDARVYEWRDELAQGGPKTLVRYYKGANQDAATALFREESPLLAERGYTPTSVSWAQGQWGCGAFVVAVLLFIVLIGILIFLYMLIVKPDGTLTVTYTKTEVAPAAVATAPVAAGTPTLTQRLEELRDAHEAGLITNEEYESRRASLIESV